MKIYIGADHAGYELKEKLKIYLEGLGHVPEDKGAHQLDANDDYPDFVKEVSKAVGYGGGSMGIVLGGSGQGEAMCANKVLDVRCAVFYGGIRAVGAVDVAGKASTDPYEIVRLAREHNNANILSLGVRFMTEDEAKEAVRIFIETPFSEDPRHVRRLGKF